MSDSVITTRGPETGLDSTGVNASTSAPMLQFATRSYWLIALAFGPFVYAWTRHRSDRAGRTALAVGAMVLVKSLCGYEYLSSILGGGAIWLSTTRAVW